jgi:GTP-binding protein
MIIKEASFVKSSADYKSCPSPDKPEYAFIGRSNVGKSSLVNMLCGIKDLAKTSSRPGKTQLINHFLINGQWYLVDLPGYGFAKASKDAIAKWETMIRTYLLRRENLLSVFVLLDSRLEPQKNDLSFMEWLGTRSIPFSIVFTKIDKENVNRIHLNIEVYKKELLKQWEELPPLFMSSAEKQRGREEILAYISETNMLFPPAHLTKP